MKRMLLILAVIITLSGCAFFQNQKANWEACKADVACYEAAKANQGRWEKIGGVVGDAVGAAPFIPPTAAKYAGIVSEKTFGYGAFALAMLLGGRALRKKKKEEVKPV